MVSDVLKERNAFVFKDLMVQKEHSELFKRADTMIKDAVSTTVRPFASSVGRSLPKDEAKFLGSVFVAPVMGILNVWGTVTKLGQSLEQIILAGVWS